MPNMGQQGTHNTHSTHTRHSFNIYSHFAVALALEKIHFTSFCSSARCQNPHDTRKSRNNSLRAAKKNCKRKWRGSRIPSTEWREPRCEKKLQNNLVNYSVDKVNESVSSRLTRTAYVRRIVLMCSLLFRQPSNWFQFAYMQKSHLRRHSSSAPYASKFAGAASQVQTVCDCVPTSTWSVDVSISNWNSCNYNNSHWQTRSMSLDVRQH